MSNAQHKFRPEVGIPVLIFGVGLGSEDVLADLVVTN